MSDRNLSGIERRRHPRVDIEGGTQLLVNGRSFKAALRDASRVGARVELPAEEAVSIDQDAEVILKSPQERSQIDIVCRVRHVSVKKDDESGTSTLSLGLESVSLDGNRDDLLGILLSSGVAKVSLGVDGIQKAIPSDVEKRIVDLLREGVRSSAVQRILGPGKPLPVVEEFDIKGQTFSEEDWAVAITIHSRPMTIIFKTYYGTEAARHFVRVKKGKMDAEVEDRLLHDFLREFCNLTAGAIKIWVSEHSGSHITGKDLLVNLPFATPASYETGHHPGKTHTLTHIYDCWKLLTHDGQGFLYCSSEIEIRNWTDVSQIAENEAAAMTAGEKPEGDDDDIEFL